MRPREARPFPGHIQVAGDPASGAFYGWRAAGWTSRRRRILVTLPQPSPTGSLWACRDATRGPQWLVPRQWHRGSQVVVEIPPGATRTATGPQARMLMCELLLGPTPVVPPDIVILGGQHPGEDPGIRVAQRLAECFRSSGAGPMSVAVVPLANAEGRLLGFTRETRAGRDPNRCWHLPALGPRLERIRALAASARFVLDIHGDEFAERPYLVAPAPCGPAIMQPVQHFLSAFCDAYPHGLRRPRAPGFGEDDPGILINWLGARGIPGVMLELPMRLARCRHDTAARSVAALEAKVARAVQRALAAVGNSAPSSRLDQERPE